MGCNDSLTLQLHSSDFFSSTQSQQADYFSFFTLHFLEHGFPTLFRSILCSHSGRSSSYQPATPLSILSTLLLSFLHYLPPLPHRSGGLSGLQLSAALPTGLPSIPGSISGLPPPTALPSSIDSLSGLPPTNTAACYPISLFARGITEPGNVGYVAGPPLASAPASLLGSSSGELGV